MIKTLLFDFGDVFINLDKTATSKAFAALGSIPSETLNSIHHQYEIGQLTTADFLRACQHHLPEVPITAIQNAWNAILLDFPMTRLHFLQKLAKQKRYQLLLLSNTNTMHIDWIKANIPFYEDFKACFDAFYLSHEIHLRKPNRDSYDFVCTTHQLIPSEILCIDDTKANTDTAEAIGMHTWNIDPKDQDVTSLFTIKSELF